MWYFAVMSDSLNTAAITQYYNADHTVVPLDYFDAFVGNIITLYILMISK